MEDWKRILTRSSGATRVLAFEVSGEWGGRRGGGGGYGAAGDAAGNGVAEHVLGGVFAVFPGLVRGRWIFHRAVRVFLRIALVGVVGLVRRGGERGGHVYLLYHCIIALLFHARDCTYLEVAMRKRRRRRIRS